MRPARGDDHDADEGDARRADPAPSRNRPSVSARNATLTPSPRPPLKAGRSRFGFQAGGATTRSPTRADATVRQGRTPACCAPPSSSASAASAGGRCNRYAAACLTASASSRTRYPACGSCTSIPIRTRRKKPSSALAGHRVARRAFVPHTAATGDELPPPPTGSACWNGCRGRSSIRHPAFPEDRRFPRSLGRLAVLRPLPALHDADAP